MQREDSTKARMEMQFQFSPAMVYPRGNVGINQVLVVEMFTSGLMWDTILTQYPSADGLEGKEEKNEELKDYAQCFGRSRWVHDGAVN